MIGNIRRLLLFMCVSTVIVTVYNAKWLDGIHLQFVHASRTNIENDVIAPDKTVRLREHRIQDYPIANISKTKPPFYPLNGTGKTVNIWTDFDVERFKDFCEMEKNLVAIVPVYSTPDNFERRKAMRETVGKVCAQLKCKMFFIVGVSLNKTIYDKVKREYVTANDILIVDKVDTYRYLNNKVVAMLDWLNEFCQRPKYVIHIIDDFFPNLKRIMDQLNSIKRNSFILGEVNRGAIPDRNPFSKWYISKTEYPYNRYPPYPMGVVYAFLNNQSVILRQKLHAVKYCWVEDVWFTGHVREGAGLEAIQLSKHYKTRMPKGFIKSPLKQCSGFHNLKPRDFYTIYNSTKLHV